MSLSAEEVDEELSILRQMMRFGGKNKSEALAAYSELGDDEWSKLLMDGELFGIKGQYAFVYSDDVITSFGFHWMMDDYETHSNHIIYCLNTYFGDYTTSKEFYTGGTTYSQYKWTKTTDDMWFVHLSLQKLAIRRAVSGLVKKRPKRIFSFLDFSRMSFRVLRTAIFNIILFPSVKKVILYRFLP